MKYMSKVCIKYKLMTIIQITRSLCSILRIMELNVKCFFIMFHTKDCDTVRIDTNIPIFTKCYVCSNPFSPFLYFLLLLLLPLFLDSFAFEIAST